MQKKKDKNVKTMTTIAILGAMVIILGLTGIGIIDLGFIGITILHIPVIIGAIIGGPVVGAGVGFIFGLYSFFRALTTPTLTSFIFLNPIISIIPRIMIGLTTAYSYKGLIKRFKADTLPIGISAFIGSITNSILVIGLIFILYKDSFASIFNMNTKVANGTIFGVILTNGVPEAIGAVLITIPIAKAVISTRKNRR